MKVVLLHAFPLDERMWESQRAALADLGVEAPRLYGRGNTMEALAESILAAIDGDLVPVGASMGGYCALAIARAAPERILGLALVGSRTDADSPERRAARADLIDRIRADGAAGAWEAMRDRLFTPDSPPEVVERARATALEQDPDELLAALEAIRDRPDSTEIAEALGDQLLVVVGDRDPYVAVEEARAFSTGGVAVFLGCGHLPSLEQPERFNHVLLDFLGRWR